MNQGDEVRVLCDWRLFFTREKQPHRFWATGKLISDERQTPEGIIYHWAEIYPPAVLARGSVT